MNNPYRRWRLETFALVAAIVAQVGGMIAIQGRGLVDIVVLVALLFLGYTHLDAKAPDQDLEED
jgi:hypothetical protein